MTNTLHRRALTALLLLVAAASPVAGLVTYTDTFEDDTVPDPPTASWYDFTFAGIGQGRVTSAASLSTVNSVILQDQDASSAASVLWDMSPAGVDLCEGGTVNFSVNLTSFHTPSAGNIIGMLGLQDRTVNQIANFEIFDTGNVRGKIDNTAGLVFATLTTNLWYDFRINLHPGSCVNGAQAKATFYITQGGAEIGLQEVTDPSMGCALGDCEFTEILLTASHNPATPTWYIDNIIAANVNDPPPSPIGALATVSVPDLVGFSVDKSPTLVIARHNNGADVSTYSAITLANAAGPEATDCTRSDAVLSQRTPSGPLVLYMDCEPGGNPDTFKIRTGTLTVPSSLSGCGTGCADIDTNEFASPIDDDQGELSEIIPFPIDFNVQQSGTGINNPSVDTWKLAWAWSGTGSLTGEVGVALYTNCQATITCDDDARLARQNFGGTSGAAEDICTGQDGTQPYMAVADTSVPTQVYPITFTNSSRTGTTVSDLRASIGTPSVFAGQQGSAIGVACGQARIGIVTPTTVSVVDRGGGAPLWTAPCSCKTRGVAMSDLRSNNTQYVAWLDGNGYFVAHANNGTRVASGTFGAISGHTDTAMDQNAQYYYIASNDLIAVYPIHFVTGSTGTTGQPVLPTTPIPTGEFGGLQPAVDGLDAVFGAGNGAPMLGLILILLAIAGGAAVILRAGGAPATAVIVGCSLGVICFAATLPMNLFSLPVYFGAFLGQGAVIVAAMRFGG